MEYITTFRRNPIQTSFVVLLLLLVIRNNLIDKTEDSRNVFPARLEKSNNEYSRALHDSGGFFDDIKTDHWELMRQRVNDAEYICKHRCIERQGDRNGEFTRWFALLFDWEPTFTCPFERRIGGLGDGSKWVCDPHRIKAQVEERGCLVYSVGSFGDFTFEDAVHDDISNKCEIHTIDPESGRTYKDIAPKYVDFHSWGFRHKSDETTFKSGNKISYLKTFDETVKLLGHAGRRIDIFKIDCEGCEWRTYEDWITSNVDIRQILIEIHFLEDDERAKKFFIALREAGYVMFHKEDNLVSRGEGIEYGFIKLEPSFFEGMKQPKY